MSQLMRAIQAERFKKAQQQVKARADFEQAVDEIVRVKNCSRREAIMQWLARPKGKAKKNKK